MDDAPKKERFCIVMPIIRNSYLLSKEPGVERTMKHDNFARFFRIGLQTYLQHLAWEDVFRFITIMPKKEMPDFKKGIRKYVRDPLILGKFQYIPEEDLIGATALPQGTSKTRIQMLCKLKIAFQVPTEHYLIVDDDVVLCRHFGFPDLFADKECKRLKFTPDQARHDNWWKGSADMLGLDSERALRKVNSLYKTNWVMNVTPEVFHREIAKAVVQSLEDLHGDPDWITVLFSTQARWTEYTLYWLWLIYYGDMALYRGSRTRLSDGNTSIWYAVPDLTAALRKMQKNKRQYFGVIQSNVPEHTVEAVEKAWQDAMSCHGKCEQSPPPVAP